MSTDTARPQLSLESIADQRWLDVLGNPLRNAVRTAFRNAGPAGRTVKNALHGVWLGHPLHPVLTDIPIGAWTTALALDARGAASGDNSYGRAADFAIVVGLAGAAGAAVTGLNDWSETDGRPRRLGLLHGLLNITATSFVAAAYALRRRGARRAGRALTYTGYCVAVTAAYLGGHLVYREGIGVSRAAVAEPEDFRRAPTHQRSEHAVGTGNRWASWRSGE